MVVELFCIKHTVPLSQFHRSGPIFKEWWTFIRYHNLWTVFWTFILCLFITVRLFSFTPAFASRTSDWTGQAAGCVSVPCGNWCRQHPRWRRSGERGQWTNTPLYSQCGQLWDIKLSCGHTGFPSCWWSVSVDSFDLWSDQLYLDRINLHGQLEFIYHVTSKDSQVPAWVQQHCTLSVRDGWSLLIHNIKKK